MCLTVVKTNVRKPRGIVKGFKVFGFRDTNDFKALNLIYAVKSHNNSSIVRVNVWNKVNKEAEKAEIWGAAKNRTNGTGISYPVGFHMYSKPKENGYMRVCVPVTLRRIHTVGTQDRQKTYVGYEMRVSSRDASAALSEVLGRKVKVR